MEKTIIECDNCQRTLREEKNYLTVKIEKFGVEAENKKLHFCDWDCATIFFNKVNKALQ